MIVDAHCHAWRQWPYDRTVPDPRSRGSVESLLYEMDENGVDHAAVVCARIGGGAGGAGFGNEDNNDYVSESASRHPDRISAWVDVDCVWRPEHHLPGAATRLTRIVERTGARGFTHYVGPDNDGWLRTDEAAEFFGTAARLGLIASLAVGAAWFDDLDSVAAEHRSIPILIHHMSNPSHGADREQDVAALLSLARRPNVGVKISGFNYNSDREWDFPYPDSIALFTRILDAFGAERLYWGSDFPASRHELTYRQALEVVRTHCAFAGEKNLRAILGLNAGRMLRLSGTADPVET